MNTLEFNNWWKEFMLNHEKDNDNDDSLLKELRWTLNEFNNENKIKFIDSLLKTNKLEIATHLIPLFGNRRQKIIVRITLLKNLLLPR
jgi:hypothetical protein